VLKAGIGNVMWDVGYGKLIVGSGGFGLVSTIYPAISSLQVVGCNKGVGERTKPKWE